MLISALIIGLFAYTQFLEDYDVQQVDPVVINDITQTVLTYWDSPAQLAAQGFPYDFVLLNTAGEVQYASKGNIPNTVTDAIRNRCVVQPLMIEERVVGQILIDTNANEHNANARRQLSTFSFGTIALLCIISLLFLSVMHYKIVLPFHKLKQFAKKISLGQLNEPLPMDKNNIFGLFTQSFDVMRESLLESQERQKELEQAKKELMVSLSHDIKTPVTSIQLITELLLASSPEAAMSSKLNTIADKTSQITRLVNDMMHSALEELGELKVFPTAQPSHAIVSLFKSADYRGLARISESPSCMVDMDALRMEQVIGNIITNSYKYADTAIDVTFALEGAFLRVELKDYGPGVEKEALELICNKYYRGAAARNSQQHGEGLGLYVSKLLMKKMGGTLDTYNWAYGFGVTVLVRLSA